MNTTDKKQKTSYWVEIKYQSISGNLCSVRDIVKAYDDEEAIAIAEARVKKIRRFYTIIGGDCTAMENFNNNKQ